MKPKTLVELLEGKVQISLLNEPINEPEVRLTAREIARKRWFGRRPGVASQSERICTDLK
jgi:hypothetical protein